MCCFSCTHHHHHREWKSFKNEPGYKYEDVKSNYGGIAQRWLIIYSEAAALRSEKSVEKWVGKENIALKKKMKKFNKTSYSTPELAEQAVINWYDKGLKKSEKRYHKLGIITIAEQAHYGRGRRKADAVPLSIDYQVSSVEIERVEQSILEHKHEKAQFILATNDTDRACQKINAPVEGNIFCSLAG